MAALRLYIIHQKESVYLTVQGECLRAGIPYFGLECNMRSSDDYEFDDKEILNKWKSILK